MTYQLRMVLVLFSLFTLASAVETHLQTHSAVASEARTHTSTLSLRVQKVKTKASLRGLGDTAAIAGNDDDDDDDYDDDDESEEMAASAKKEQPAVRTLNSKVSDNTMALSAALHDGVKESAEEAAAAKAAEEKQKKLEEEEAADKAEYDKEVAAAVAAQKEHQKAVEAAEANKAKAQRNVKSFNNDEAFDAKIALETKLLTNETQSPALASFLGELRTEVRQYAKPAYPAYLQAELDTANKKVQMLEEEVKDNKEEKAEAAAVKKEDSEKLEPKKEKETKEAKTGAGSGAKLAEQKAGEAFALSMFATIAMLSIVFAMASAEDKTVKNYTWFLMDQVTAIFLAVMYFNAFDSLLDFHGLPAHYAWLASVLHALAMITIVLGAAAALRKKKVALGILCTAGAHVVSFSSIHAAAGTQNRWMGFSYSGTMCLFGICTLLLTLVAVGYISYTAKRHTGLTEDDEYMDKADDVENDFAAMATSVCFTMFVRYLISGHHPVDDESDANHTSGQRNAMLFWAVICLVIAGFVTTFCAKKAAEPNASYMVKRLMAFCSTVATMNVAWSVLYWGEWEFYGVLYPDEAIKGKLLFAIVMTMLGGLVLLGLAKMKSAAASQATAEKKVALVAVSLVIAWSWELCFDAAIEAMCDGVAHPAGWKIATTLMLGAIVVPVYGLYMKPISSKAAEAIGA